MANVFLSSGGGFILGSVAKVYGSSASETTAIQNGVTGITVNQNVESVALMGNPTDYLYQRAGNQLKIFTAASELICTAQLQGDADGTRFVFANGSVYGQLTTSGMTLGGTLVGSSAPVSVSPTNIDNSVENSLSCVLASIISSEDPTIASVFLDPGDQFISGSVANFYGSTGVDKVRIQDGVSGIKVNQNVEYVIFAGSTDDYQYQRAGNQLKMYTGSNLACTIPLQGDDDGTQIVFANGSVSAKLVGSVMSFGGTTVSISAPESLIPAIIDPSATSANVIMPTDKSGDKMDISFAYNDVTDIHSGFTSSNLLSPSDLSFGGTIEPVNTSGNIFSEGGDIFASSAVTLTGLSDGCDLTGLI